MREKLNLGRHFFKCNNYLIIWKKRWYYYISFKNVKDRYSLFLHFNIIIADKIIRPQFLLNFSRLIFLFYTFIIISNKKSDNYITFIALNSNLRQSQSNTKFGKSIIISHIFFLDFCRLQQTTIATTH